MESLQSRRVFDTIASCIKRGDFTRALELLSGCESAEASLQRIRVRFRMRDFAGAFDEHARALSAHILDDRTDAGAIARVIASTAATNLKRHGEAIAYLYLIPDINTLSRAAAAEIMYYRALSAWMDGDPKRVIRRLNSRTPRSAEMRARYLLLRAWTQAHREHFFSQGQLTMDALQLLLEEATDEHALIANAAHALAALAREIVIPQALPLLERAYGIIAGGAGLHTERFQILRTLGWIKALHGNYIAALLHLRDAAMLANDDYTNLTAHVDHAVIAGWSGEQTTRRFHLVLAAQHAQAIDWEHVRGEEAVTLLHLARAVAVDDPPQAHRYLEIARRAGAHLDPSLGLAHGSRFAAYLDSAQAFIQRDERAQALRAASRARRAFERFDYAWRSAELAHLQYTLTQEAEYLEQARSLIAPYPQSWIANTLAHSVQLREQSDRLPALTARQREVLDLLLAGMSVKSIAAHLECSAATIKNHITAIHRAFGVQRRAQLFAKLRFLDYRAA